MKRFFELTFKPFFVVTGIGTMSAALVAFLPRWALETIQRIAFIEDYRILAQHWGFLVGLAGLFMIIATFRRDWRTPVLVYAASEKAFFVLLVLSNLSAAPAQAMLVPAAMDASVVVYTVAYFLANGAGRGR